MISDESIIKGILIHDEKAFEIMIDKYGGLIKSIVSYHLFSLKDYQDECVNDILLSIWQNIKSYDESKNTLKNWIGAVSKYKCIDYKRKYYKNQCFDELDENIVDARNDFENELEDEIESILCYLKEEDRVLFLRYYILGEKINEIAEETDSTPAFLFNRLSRGRKKLRKIFKGVFY